MRHRKAGLKLNRTRSHREAMFRNMVTSLFKHQRIRTTDTKAKELRRWVDDIITLAKRGDLHARRQALSIVREKEIVHKLFAEAAEKYANRSGGYTRIVKLGRRPGDAAPISLIELISSVDEKKKKTKKKKVKSPTAKKVADKKKDVKKEAPIEEEKIMEQDVETKTLDEPEEVEIEEERDKAILEQTKTDDEEELTASDTDLEDSKEKVKDEILESAAPEETQEVETEEKEPPKKAKDTESEE